MDIWLAKDAAARDTKVETCMTDFLRLLSTRLPNQIPVVAVSTRKIPAITPVANTDRVCR